MNRLKNLHKVVFATGFVVAAVLFLLVILPGHFATVNSQSDWGPTNNQASLTGTNLTYYPGSTAERCKSDCNGNANCKGFALIRAGYYNPNDPPMCYLVSEVTASVPSSCCISAVKSGGSSSGTVSIAGRWSGYNNWVYNISQNGSTFTWSVENVSQKGEGNINGKSVSVKWEGSGSGSATGTVTKVDSSGRATRIEWSNGVIFTRD